MILIDSSVLLDLFTVDPFWFEWSSKAVATLANSTEIAINPLIYAEVSVHFDSVEELDEAFPEQMFRREPLPFEAGFLAGKAFAAYRRRGGAKTSPLSDFYIGAHAAISGLSILTRDPRRFRRYFPTVEVIAP
ncbi:MAG: type II toxin-antitoxin system VapC family toxin [Pyrinomonadaceae bacterium]|nr:type II toxin-antitoxin system VapC family toxin [Pyrinomonadaceae bacterium]